MYKCKKIEIKIKKLIENTFINTNFKYIKLHILENGF